MDSFTAQYMQLHFGYGVLEVVLRGCARIQAPIGELQGPQQQPLICPQYPPFSAELWKEKQQKKWLVELNQPGLRILEHNGRDGSSHRSQSTMVVFLESFRACSALLFSIRTVIALKKHNLYCSHNM